MEMSQILKYLYTSIIQLYMEPHRLFLIMTAVLNKSSLLLIQSVVAKGHCLPLRGGEKYNSQDKQEIWRQIIK